MNIQSIIEKQKNNQEISPDETALLKKFQSKVNSHNIEEIIEKLTGNQKISETEEEFANFFFSAVSCSKEDFFSEE